MSVNNKENNLTEEEDKDFALFLRSVDNLEKQEEGHEELVEATIILISQDNKRVSVDINEKGEYSFPLGEILDKNGNRLFKERDKISVLVTVRKDGKKSVSYARGITRQKISALIEELKQSDEKAFLEEKEKGLSDEEARLNIPNSLKFIDRVIEGQITSSNSKGYSVLWLEKDIECFLPKNHSGLRHDDKSNVGRIIKSCIVRADSSIILSRKRYLEISDSLKQKRFKEVLASTEPLDGIVVSIPDTGFGVFVSLDGIDGLVHNSEMTKGFTNKDFKVGDKIKVKVIRHDESKLQLSLSMKALAGSPWIDLEGQVKVGYTLKVKVLSTSPEGARVDIGSDIEGFIPAREMTWDKSKIVVDNYLKKDEEIDAKVIELDIPRERLILSLRELTEHPFLAFLKKYRAGDVVKGNVNHFAEFGAFIRIDNVDALLHNSEVSWDRNAKAKDLLKQDEEIEVKILSIDATEQRISLSRKELIDSPVKKFSKGHKIGDIVKGKISQINRNSLFIISEGAEMLIRNEELPPLNRDDLKVGDEIEAAISMLDAGNNRIHASVKKMEAFIVKNEVKHFNERSSSIGNQLKDALSRSKNGVNGTSE